MKPSNQNNMSVQITFRNSNLQTIVNGCPVPYITQVQPLQHAIQQKHQNSSNTLHLASISTISLNPNPKKQTTLLKTKSNITQIYMLVVHESGAGQSYHEKQHAVVSGCIDDILMWASSCFADVHRQDECKSISDGECDCQALLEDVVNGLRSVGYSQCSATGGKVEDVTFSIFKIPVRRTKS